jgi:rod shape-determining protein MreC
MVRRFLTYLAIVILLFFVPLTIVKTLRGTADGAISPIGSWLTSEGISIRNFFMNLMQIGKLREERAALQQNIVDLQQKLIDQESLQSENSALRQELDVTGATKDVKKVLGRVIIEGSNPLDRTFTIDVGDSQGVMVGQPAIYKGALIGRVITVREGSAVVRTITSQESRIQASIVGTQEKGLLVGNGNSVSLQEITQGVTIPDDNVVETSGLGGTLPQGILIGSISGTLSQKSDLSQRFSIKLNEDPANVQSVFILLIDNQ